MNTALGPSVRAAFEGLVDYAGLFPPARLEMAAALADFRDARNTSAAWMLGRFIVPLSRVQQATTLCRDGDAPLVVALIVDVGTDARRWFAELQTALAQVQRLRRESAKIEIAQLEVALPIRSSARETFDAPIAQLGVLLERHALHDLPAYVEFPPPELDAGLLAGGMTALVRARLRGKLRCGGLTASAFPSVEAIAAYIGAAARHDVAFKATAGLHHPIRHVDAATGFTMHGFLNLLGAAVFAPDENAEVLERIVGEEDAAAFGFDDAGLTWRGKRAAVNRMLRARAESFVAYGSCSFSEPVEDLTAMRLLPASNAS